MVAQDVNVSACLPGVSAGGVECAGDVDDSFIAAYQVDGAVFLDSRFGLDDTVHVDDLVDYVPGGADLERDDTAVGENTAVVTDQGSEFFTVNSCRILQNFAIDSQSDQLVAVEIEGEGAAGDKADPSQPRVDDAGVRYAGGDQGDESALDDADLSFIDDGGRKTRLDVEIVLSGHEVFIADIDGGGDKPVHVDPRILAEEDSVAVDEE